MKAHRPSVDERGGEGERVAEGEQRVRASISRSSVSLYFSLLAHIGMCVGV